MYAVMDLDNATKGAIVFSRWRGRTSTRPGRGKGGSAGRAARRGGRGARRSRPGPLLRRAQHQGAPGLRAAAEAAVGRDHCRAAGRQPAVPGRAGSDPGAQTGPGHPRTRPDRVLADKAYGSRANRAYLRRRGIACTIPEKAGQVRNRKNKGRAGGRPPALTPGCTSSATQWNAGSPGSSATGPWPRATTSSASATRPPSTSPRSTNGCSPTS